VSPLRRTALAFLAAIMGTVAGGVIGLGLGLAYTTLAATSNFEGNSGFVVAYWMLGGILLGLVAGPLWALRWSRKRD
jgi:predicted histidine transporter YuiF (NhaC family)